MFSSIVNGDSLFKIMPSSVTKLDELLCAVLQAKNLSLNPKVLFLLCTWHLLMYCARRWALSCNAAGNKGRAVPLPLWSFWSPGRTADHPGEGRHGQGRELLSCYVPSRGVRAQVKFIYPLP